MTSKKSYFKWLKENDPEKLKELGRKVGKLPKTKEHQSNAGKKAAIKLQEWRKNNPELAKEVYQNAQKETVKILKQKPNHYLNMGLKARETPHNTKHELIMKRLLPTDFIYSKRLGIGVPDFHSPERKIVIEVDGENHYAQCIKNRDRKKERCWKEMGYKIFRFKNYEVDRYMKSLLSL